MIRPVHRDMVLRMASRGLPPTAIRDAMGRSISLDLIREIVADGGASQRLQATAVRLERVRARQARHQGRAPDARRSPTKAPHTQARKF